MAAGRTRLDDARQALLEAEQAARNPELDRDVVERLELAHAELLDALEKADGRFAGAARAASGRGGPERRARLSSTSSASCPTPTT